MRSRRPSPRSFVLGSLTIVAVVLAVWLSIDEAWLEHIAIPARKYLCLIASSTGSLLVIAWAAMILWKSRQNEERTETKFRTLLECAPDALILMDRQGRIVLVNRRTEEMFGYERAQLLGKPADSLVRKQNSSAPLASESSLSMVSTESRSIQPEGFGYHKDGRQIPLEMSFNPLQTEDGLLIVNTVRDCSEKIMRESRRTTRRAVKSSLAEAGTLAEAAPDLLQTVCENLDWDLGILCTFDPQTQQFQHTLRPLGEVSPSEKFAPPCITLASRVLKSGQAVWISDCAKEPDLAEEPLVAQADLHAACGIPVTFGDEFVGVLQFFSHQSRETDEPQLEMFRTIGSQIGQFMKRKQAEEAARASEARKAAILEAAPDGIVTIDSEGKIIELNSAAEDMLGHTRDWIMGQDMAELIIPTSWRGHFREALAKNLASGQGLSDGRRLEMSALGADGKEFPVEVTVSRIRGEGPPSFTSYIRDISERKQAEKTLRQTEERCRQAQKMEAIGRLAGGVAHDFNNLLTVITGYSELLIGTFPEGDPSIGLLREIAKAAERASRLTGQLLAFSRKQVLSAEVIDLNTLVTDISKMLQRLIGEDINLVPVLAPGLDAVKTDPGQIEQVIMNLAVNARDAMPQGGTLTLETADVELDETYTRDFPELQPGPYVLLAVSDTGCGMDAAVKARVFEPFFTTKEVGQGTGLGLATVYGIVKQSGGQVTVYSEPGQGTTFKIYLPSVQGAVPVLHQASAPASPALGTGTVLVVEDEDGVRALTRKVLQKKGYKVLEARHGLEALEVCGQQEKPVELVVTDMVMPQMNGAQLAERMRGRWPNLPILFLSGYSDCVLSHKGLLHANQNFLQKPFTPNDLTSKVHEMLGT